MDRRSQLFPPSPSNAQLSQFSMDQSWAQLLPVTPVTPPTLQRATQWGHGSGRGVTFPAAWIPRCVPQPPRGGWGAPPGAPTLPRVEKLSWKRKERISTRSIPRAWGGTRGQRVGGGSGGWFKGGSRFWGTPWFWGTPPLISPPPLADIGGRNTRAGLGCRGGGTGTRPR